MFVSQSVFVVKNGKRCKEKTRVSKSMYVEEKDQVVDLDITKRRSDRKASVGKNKPTRRMSVEEVDKPSTVTKRPARRSYEEEIEELVGKGKYRKTRLDMELHVERFVGTVEACLVGGGGGGGGFKYTRGSKMSG